MITNALSCVNNERLFRMRAVFVARGDKLQLKKFVINTKSHGNIVN